MIGKIFYFVRRDAIRYILVGAFIGVWMVLERHEGTDILRTIWSQDFLTYFAYSTIVVFLIRLIWYLSFGKNDRDAKAMYDAFLKNTKFFGRKKKKA